MCFSSLIPFAVLIFTQATILSPWPTCHSTHSTSHVMRLYLPKQKFFILAPRKHAFNSWIAAPCVPNPSLSRPRGVPSLPSNKVLPPRQFLDRSRVHPPFSTLSHPHVSRLTPDLILRGSFLNPTTRSWSPPQATHQWKRGPCPPQHPRRPYSATHSEKADSEPARGEGKK